MAYRDERETLRAKVERLERELEEERLRSSPVPLPSTRWSWLSGAPRTLRLEREVKGGLDAALRSDLVDALRRSFDTLGQVSEHGSTLGFTLAGTGSQRLVEVMISSRDRETQIRISEQLSGLAGGLFGGIIGGLGGGASSLVYLPMGRLFGSSVACVATGLWLLGTYGLARFLFRRKARQRMQQLARVADELTALVEDAHRAQPVRARVKALPDASLDEVLDSDSEASSRVPRGALRDS